MTPQTRAELEQKLAAHGLTVLLTRDFDAIMLQLDRLAQFERLMQEVAEGNPPVEFAMGYVRAMQHYPVESRPMEILDIPEIMIGLLRELHEQINRGTRIRCERITAATTAFIGIITAR